MPATPNPFKSHLMRKLKVMSNRSKKVLKHWKENVALCNKGRCMEVDLDGDSCAYCKGYADMFLAPGADCCPGCPVRLYTGETNCQDTPYQKAYIHFRYIEITWGCDDDHDFDRDELSKAVKEEYKFLQKLDRLITSAIESKKR